jgi:nucleoside-diphosphate-sugar epimerase
MTGFVGSALVKSLAEKNIFQIIGTFRSPNKLTSLYLKNVSAVHLPDLSANLHSSGCLNSVETIVHTVALVHNMKEKTFSSLNEYRRVNVDVTVNLARHAASAGVKRFIFLSSIKVNGERTDPGRPFSVFDDPAPKDPYGVSKYEAEQRLRELEQTHGIEIVIIRLPLVYGAEVKGNFKSLLQLCSKGIPLPFGSIHNKRSFIGLDNLIDFIVTCITHPAAAHQTFLVSDNEDLSTTELLNAIGKAKNVPVKLLPFPPFLLRIAAAIIGKNHLITRLCDSLQIDASHARNVLGWTPPFTIHESLRRIFEKRNL